MFREKKFVRKTTKFDRRIKKAPDMAEIRGNTPNLEERPAKYLNRAMEKLNISEDLKSQILDIFEHVRFKTSRLRGYADPMPELAGIIYFVCRINMINLSREIIANAFGINKEMVTKGHKTIKSLVITTILRNSKNSIICPRCGKTMSYEDSFWKCSSCISSAYGYDLRKGFLKINRTQINYLLSHLYKGIDTVIKTAEIHSVK